MSMRFYRRGKRWKCREGKLAHMGGAEGLLWYLISLAELTADALRAHNKNPLLPLLFTPNHKHKHKHTTYVPS